MSPPGPLPKHHFGPFTYDPAERILFHEDQLVPLVPKLAATLHVLLENRGRIVEKSELIRCIWPDAVVEETGLARNISLLRKTFGDESEQYIQTIPKRGYRFVPAEDPTRPEPPPKPAPPSKRRPVWPLVAVTAAGIAAVVLMYWQFIRPGRFVTRPSDGPSIAVLPFQPIPPQEATRQFDETIVAALAQVEDLHIVSPSTVARYQGAGVPPHLMARILGLDALLEGTIQAGDGAIRVTARLSDVHSGRIIWANRYDHALAAGPVEAVQLNIAKSIALDLEPHLSRKDALRPATP